tara:strand:- start:4091 stop:5944 length:1854 start_codon:yes stop_codon:yes gene_type:complete
MNKHFSDGIIFDIETNGIQDFRSLSDLKQIHCIVLCTVNGDIERYSCNGGNIKQALTKMALADVLIGHNILGFDIPAIKKLYPSWNPTGCIRDTLIISRLHNPDIRAEDLEKQNFPFKLAGRHSLEAWGHRLGVHKDNYGAEADWSQWSQELEDYCAQDVRVNQSLWKYFVNATPSPLDSEESLILEHDFFNIIKEQEQHGFAFDKEKAVKLYAQLQGKRVALEQELKTIFPPKILPMKTPQYWETEGKQYSTKGEAIAAGHKPSTITKGPLREKVIPFNPQSRKQIADAFIEKYNWEPLEYTNDGRPKVNETILETLPYDEARVFCNYLTICKRLGQIGDGKEAWLKCEEDGRIHGRVNTLGTCTGRASHSRPNVAQTPAVKAPWGKECRELFTVPEGYCLVGADMSGIELRCLAHYLARWDGGEYTNEIINGDIHTMNMHKAGLDDRNTAKTMIYALCYGAGATRLGEIVGGGAKEGETLKRKFFAQLPALRLLREHIDATLEKRSYLKGIDARVLRIRSNHSALNTLLQSAGAVLMKKATTILHGKIRQQQWTSNDCVQVAHVHDELQLQCREDIAEDVGELAVQSFKAAGEYFEFKCPLDGEFKTGRTWADTH